MFSVVFPGQGSQVVGMAKEFYDKFDLTKKIFREADEILNFPISELILKGPKDKLDLTENTQPAIFIVSYSIYKIITQEFNIDLKKAKFFAGHSLGEYTALACSGVINFSETLKILKKRGLAMQNAVSYGKGGMLAVLGIELVELEKILEKNKNKYECFIANDNSNGQIVVSGTKQNIDFFSNDLNNIKIKNIKLSVSAPFHCKLMSKATDEMRNEIKSLELLEYSNKVISNVTAKEISDKAEIKDLLVKQIEHRVRWRESIKFMLNNHIKKFIEIGPGRVLTGLIKRIDRSVYISAINNESDILNLKIDDWLQ